MEINNGERLMIKILSGDKVPIRITRGDPGRLNPVGTVTKIYPEILYRDVCYVAYYGTSALFAIKDVFLARSGGNPLAWPHHVPMDSVNSKMKRRSRDRQRYNRIT